MSCNRSRQIVHCTTRKVGHDKTAERSFGCKTAGNILTHLLPAAAQLAAILLGWLPAWPGALHNWIGQVGAIFVCLCGSVTYHTLMAHHQNYRTWLAVDVSLLFLLSILHLALLPATCKMELADQPALQQFVCSLPRCTESVPKTGDT